MEEALITRLAAAATSADDRWSWHGRARDDAPPSGVLLKITPGEEWTHDGPDGLDRPRVRFDLYGATDQEVLTLARELKVEMRTERTVAGVKFHPAMLDAERTLDASEEEGGAGLFRIQQEYLFYFEETD
jgi:hypothetical protein